MEDLDIARVGRLAVEGIVPQRGPAEAGRDKPVLDEIEPHPAVFPRMVGGPKLHPAHDPALLGQDGNEVPEILDEKLRLQGNQLPVHKLVYHGGYGLHLVTDLEIHSDLLAYL